MNEKAEWELSKSSRDLKKIRNLMRKLSTIEERADRRQKLRVGAPLEASRQRSISKGIINEIATDLRSCHELKKALVLAIAKEGTTAPVTFERLRIRITCKRKSEMKL